MTVLELKFAPVTDVSPKQWSRYRRRPRVAVGESATVSFLLGHGLNGWCAARTHVFFCARIRPETTIDIGAEYPECVSALSSWDGGIA